MTIIRRDIGLIYSLLPAIANCIDLSLLIDYSTYFKDVITQYCLLSIQSVVRFIEVFNNRNEPNRNQMDKLIEKQARKMNK